jgi:phosphohistidine phosphatase
MLIYIIRHGKAEDSSDSGRDEDRMLKKKGHRQAEAIASHLHDCAVPPAMVLASPYTRAVETAAPIWAKLKQLEQIDDRLAAHRSLSDSIDVLIDSQGAESVAIVGHNPTCARLVSTLTRGLTSMPSDHRTGEMVILEAEETELIGNCDLIQRFRLDS